MQTLSTRQNWTRLLDDGAKGQSGSREDFQAPHLIRGDPQPAHKPVPEAPEPLIASILGTPRPPKSSHQSPKDSPHAPNHVQPTSKHNFLPSKPHSNLLKPAKTYVFLKVFIHFPVFDKILKICPKAAPRPPKWHPKVTKWSPRGPQGLPKSSQGPPKDHPSVPNTSKMSLKGSTDPPRHQKGSPEGTIWTPFCSKIRSPCFFLGAGGRGACAFRSAAPCRRQVPACLEFSQVGSLRILSGISEFFVPGTQPPDASPALYHLFAIFVACKFESDFSICFFGCFVILELKMEAKIHEKS